MGTYFPKMSGMFRENIDNAVDTTKKVCSGIYSKVSEINFKPSFMKPSIDKEGNIDLAWR